MFAEDWDADRVNRERMLDDLEFIAGEQWDKVEKDLREAEGRPCLTINRLPQFVRQVVGDLRNIRPSIKIRPNGYGSDEDMAEIFNGLIRNIEERSKDEQPYTSAVESAVRCGIGHFRIETDTLPDNPFFQDIFIRPIHSPLSVVWDRAARSVTRSDASHCFVRDAMPRTLFEKEYPDVDPDDFGESMSLEHQTYWSLPERVIVAEVFEKERARADFALLENGAVVRMDRLPVSMAHDPINERMVRADGGSVFIEEIRTANTMRVVWRKITGAGILDSGEWATPDIPIIPVIGEEVHFEKTMLRAGLVRWAKDPQRLYNYWRSTQTEIMGAAPKAPYILGASQAEGFEDLWATANRGNKPFLVFDDSRNAARPSREAPPVASSGMNNEIALAAEDMKATTGIYDAALGAQSNETSGVAIRQRQTEGDISTNFFGDNLAASMRRAGRILLDLIPIVYDTQRVVRIVAEDSTSKLAEVNRLVIESGLPRIYNDLTVGDYDVTVDIGPAYTTKRQEAVEGMREILQGQPFAQYFLDLVARNADWPGADEFVERAKKLLPPQLQEDDEEVTPEQQAARQQEAALQQMQMEMQMRAAQTELADKQAKTAKTVEETKGEQIENAQKALQLAMNSAQMQALVRDAVASILAGHAGSGISSPAQ